MNHDNPPNSLQADHRELKQQFADVTGSTTSVAQYWLGKHSWDLAQATNAYFLKYGSSAPPAKRTKLNNSHIAAIFDKYKGMYGTSTIFMITTTTSQWKSSILTTNYFTDNETGNIEIEGTIQYLEDLGYDAEDPVALVLAYFLESPSTGVFKKDSFINQWSHKKYVFLLAFHHFFQCQ